METRRFDIAVIGGSLGGVQAARAAADMGMRVYLCGGEKWIGGQLTSQAVPPDENAWIETEGATATYRRYRQAVRDWYKNDPLTSEALKRQDVFCPGKSWVSRVAHDPRLAHRLLLASLKPGIEGGLIAMETETRAAQAETAGGRVVSVTVRRADGTEARIEALYFLDATDTGELLPLTGTEYRVGAEGKGETGEEHALPAPDPLDQQPVTWVAALALDKERTPMARPDSYGFFSRQTAHGLPVLSWECFGGNGITRFAMFDGESKDWDLGLWNYRRIQYAPYYTDGRPDVSLLNWPQNDYIFGPVIDTPDAGKHLEMARELTKCVAYWLWEQGYPVRLTGEFVGTADGLAQAPYIRESRRIQAKKRILEEEIALTDDPSPVHYADSVGVGHYAMDLHRTTHTGTAMYRAARRFEIPLSAMIPVRTRNLLPACKNIGATHVTGGCFRLHPVEWTVGEAAGYLAAFCVKNALSPAQVLESCLSDFQALLTAKGFQLHWKDQD